MKNFVIFPSLVLLCSINLCSYGQVATQSTADVGTPTATPTTTRLEQLESTYLFSLRKYHAPVLLDYQHDLERLKQQLVARGRPEDAKHIDAEIEYVKTLITSTSIMPYTSLLPPPPVLIPDKPTTEPEIGKPLRRKKGLEPTLALNAADTSKSLHAMNAKTESLPIGSAEWKISSLPAGSYDIVIFFSCEALEKPEKITLRLAGQDFVSPLAVERATGSETNFRPMRLAKITLDQPVSNGVLSIQSETPAIPHFTIRNIVFLKKE